MHNKDDGGTVSAVGDTCSASSDCVPMHGCERRQGRGQQDDAVGFSISAFCDSMAIDHFGELIVLLHGSR